MTTVPSILTLEAAIRGCAAGFSLLSAWRLSILGRHSPAAGIGAVFCMVMAVYIAFSSPALRPWMEAAFVPLVLTINQGAVLLWLFSIALFDDDFRWHWKHALPPTMILLLSIGTLLGPEVQRTAFFLAYQTASASLLALVLLVAVRSLKSDLVSERRRFAIALSILVPFTGLVTAAVDVLSLWQPSPPTLVALQSATMLLLSALFTQWIASQGLTIFAKVDRSGASMPVMDRNIAPADTIELRRIRELIAAGVLLKPETSVSNLARLAGLPEHRLRRLVNDGMGYRNFRSLVNDYRIEEAKRRLADPARVREQMIVLSFDLGYVSLAPFNRAFRERTGMNPTEFRKLALGSILID